MSVTEAYLAAARAAAPRITVYDVDRPFNDGSAQTPLRYAVLSADPGSVESLSLAEFYDDALIEMNLLSVGPDRSSVEQIQVAIRDAFMGKIFVDGGWSASVIEHRSQAARRDMDIPGRVVIFGTDQYTIQAQKV